MITVEGLFGLVVRLAGLAFFVFGLSDLFHAVATMTGLPMPSRYPVATDLLAGGIWLVLGGILFVAADPITRLAYRKRRNPN